MTDTAEQCGAQLSLLACSSPGEEKLSTPVVIPRRLQAGPSCQQRRAAGQAQDAPVYTRLHFLYQRGHNIEYDCSVKQEDRLSAMIDVFVVVT